MFKTFLAAVLAASLIGCNIPSSEDKMSVNEATRFSYLRDATWELTSDEGSCSAVVIKENMALTAAHCDGLNMKIAGIPAVMVKKSAEADLMLLYVDGLPCPCVPVSLENPEQDTVVATIGFPLGLGEVLTEGRVQGPVPMEEDMPEELKVRLAHLTIVTSPVIFGNSGGPVFALIDGEYRVVGIVSAVAIAALGFLPNVIPHLAFVVSTPTIKEFVHGKISRP